MKRLLFIVTLAAAAIVTVARGGHELPVYPSFYPHEIEIRTIAPHQAAGALQSGKMHAYVGPGLNFPSPPADLGAVESLGAFVIVRLNPQSPLATDATACNALRT